MHPLATFGQAFRLPDLRKRILFTFLMFGIYILGAQIPMPGVDVEVVARKFQLGGGLFNLANTLVGGSLKRLSVLALGVMPYITASIVFQMLTFAWPYMEELNKQGEYGRKQIAKWTRYLTIGICFIQGYGLIAYFGFGAGGAFRGLDTLMILRLLLTMTAGTCFLMWMGEQISDKGIGNGISLVIFVGIMVVLPEQIAYVMVEWRAGSVGAPGVMFLVALLLGLVAAIITVQQAHRKIPIQHGKRIVGQRVYGGHQSYLPVMVNQAGVIPIIFAITVVMFPAQIAMAIGHKAGDVARILHVSTAKVQDVIQWVATNFSPGTGQWISLAIYFVSVIVFTYFYTAIIWKPVDIADDLRKAGSAIPGIRPGEPTALYLAKIMGRVTLGGALFLGAIAVSPYIVPVLTGVTGFTLVGGTSLLIVVGVALDTVKQLEAHLLMRQYEGFVK